MKGERRQATKHTRRAAFPLEGSVVVEKTDDYVTLKNLYYNIEAEEQAGSVTRVVVVIFSSI